MSPVAAQLKLGCKHQREKHCRCNVDYDFEPNYFGLRNIRRIKPAARAISYRIAAPHRNIAFFRDATKTSRVERHGPKLLATRPTFCGRFAATRIAASATTTTTTSA